MAQRKYLVDTNSYLRLAGPLHRFLFREIGPDRACFYVLDELEYEVRSSARLRSAFPWFDEPAFRENRGHPLNVSRANQRQIEAQSDLIFHVSHAARVYLSPVDCRCFAHALVLDITLVTDEREMRAYAKELGVTLWTSLDVLHYCLEAGDVSMDDVHRIVGEWRRHSDLPSDFHADFRRLFKLKPRFI